MPIDRPPANALSPDSLEEGAAVADRLRSDAPDAIVFAGRPGYFSAGMDLKIAPTLDAEGQQRTVTGINFGLTELKAGIPYPAVALAVVAAELSRQAARRLALRADLVDAATAQTLGAFDKQVGDDPLAANWISS